MEQNPPTGNGAIPDDSDDDVYGEEQEEEKSKLLKLRVFINIDEDDDDTEGKNLDLKQLFKRVDPALSFYKDVR